MLANTASMIDVGALVGQAASDGVADAMLTAIVGLDQKTRRPKAKVKISAMSASWPRKNTEAKKSVRSLRRQARLLGADR